MNQPSKTIRKRIVCRVCGPQRRVLLIDPTNEASWERLEREMDKHENSYTHRSRSLVYAETVEVSQ